MVYRGHVREGKVELSEPLALPDGAEVTVRLVKPRRKVAKTRRRATTLAERLAPFIGKAKGLPADFARNHDHYLYGVPKQ